MRVSMLKRVHSFLCRVAACTVLMLKRMMSPACIAGGICHLKASDS